MQWKVTKVTKNAELNSVLKSVFTFLAKLCQVLDLSVSFLLLFIIVIIYRAP